MNYITTSTKIAGSPGNTVCAQAYEISPDEDDRLMSHGKLNLVVLGTGAQDSTQSVLLTRGIAAQIQKKYFSSDPEDQLQSLSSAVKDTVEQYNSKIELGLVASVGDTAYIITYGGAKVLLSRDSNVAVFESDESSLKSAAGQVRVGDLLVIATSGFFRTIPSGVLNAAIDKSSTTKIADFLAPTILSKDNNSEICAMFIKVDAQEFPKETILLKEQEEKVQKDTTQESPKKIRESVIDRIKKKRFYIKEFQDEKVNKRRKVFSVLGVVLLLLLAGTVITGLKQKKENEKLELLQKVSASVDRNLKEADEVFSYSPQRSQEILNKSREEIATLEGKEIAQAEIDALRKKVDQAEGDVLGMHNAAADLFIDLNLLSSGFDGDSIAFSNNSVYVLDKDGKRLISSDISNKRSEVLAGQDVLEGVLGVAAYFGDVYVLKKDGIYSIEKEKLIDSNWSENSLIESYSGNVYVLDKETSEIWRYSESDGEFSPRTRWLANDVSADFSKVISWGIDGAVWLFTSTGNVYRYTYGYQQSLTLDKVSPEIGSEGNIFVRNENQNIYILDKDNSRILVFDKEGGYKAQYNQEIIKGAKDLAVFEEEKKIIILTGDKLQHIDIQ